MLCLAACGSVDARSRAAQQAQQGGLSAEDVAAAPFHLTAYVRIRQPGLPLRVYLEGDGYAWRARDWPSSDPTPLHATALALAAVDASPNVLYLARPCQFRNLAHEPCDSRYWTDRRYAEAVVAAMNAAIDPYRIRAATGSIELVGYSGGAAIAVLLASRRSDVVSLRTVAGNLDHVALNAYHQVAQMPESLNPLEVAQHLSELPQLHFIGGRDTIVPPFIAQSFVARVGGACANVVTVDEASHARGWIEVWQSLLATPVACRVRG